MLMPTLGRKGTLALIDTWQRVIALVVLVLEVFLLAIIARSDSVEWYLVVLGIIPLVVIIIGVFFGPRARRQLLPRASLDIGPKVDFLRGRLASERFTPDLIIGLSRGGLVVAARLSYELGLNPPVPTISLWPHSADYDNALNSFDLQKIWEMQKKDGLHFDGNRLWNILVIDDACKSGRSLDYAKRYVVQKLGEIRSRVRTAALEIERGTYTTQIEPDFYASAEIISKDAWGEEEEP
jgi:hypoxanthine phosphoribosyltransferase